MTQIVRSDAADVGLDQLAGLLCGRHARQQRLDPRLECRVGHQGGRQLAASAADARGTGRRCDPGGEYRGRASDERCAIPG